MALNVNNLFNKTYWLGAQNYLRLFPEHPEMQCLLQLINSKSCLYEKKYHSADFQASMETVITK